MTYDPNIPLGGDDMTVSQPMMLANFTDLNTVYGSSGDHVALNAAIDRGKHKRVTFVSQGSNPETDSPPTEENEIALYALENSGSTVLYLRPESNGTPNQVTKGNEFYTRVYPVFAINMDNTLTVFESFNYDSGTGVTRLSGGSSAHFNFPFTNPVLDPSGVPTNNYLWIANAFNNTTNPVVGEVPMDATYGNQVGNNFIRIIFRDQTGAVITNMTRCSVVCWRFQ